MSGVQFEFEDTKRRVEKYLLFQRIKKLFRRTCGKGLHIPMSAVGKVTESDLLEGTASKMATMRPPNPQLTAAFHFSLPAVYPAI